MIPANEWWAVLQNYNETIFPAQIALYLLAAGVAGIFIWKPGEVASHLAKGYFALAFGWIGIVFFLALGQELPAHNAQAFLFLSLAGLFSLDLVTNTSSFRMPGEGWRKTATLAGFGLALAYPLVGLLAGRPPSGWIIPGAFPCPTTAQALIFMTMATLQKRRWVVPGCFGSALAVGHTLFRSDPDSTIRGLRGWHHGCFGSLRVGQLAASWSGCRSIVVALLGALLDPQQAFAHHRQISEFDQQVEQGGGRIPVILHANARHQPGAVFPFGVEPPEPGGIALLVVPQNPLVFPELFDIDSVFPIRTHRN